MKALHYADGNTVIAAIDGEDIQKMEMADRYRKVLAEILGMLTKLLAPKHVPPADPFLVDPVQPKLGRPAGKKRGRPAKVVKAAKVAGKRGPSLVDKAVEVMAGMERPCLIIDIVAAMKKAGVKFRTDNPTDSLGVQLTASKRAKVVARDGNKGLWDLAGAEKKAVSTQAQTTPAIDKEKRLQLIRDMAERTQNLSADEI